MIKCCAAQNQAPLGEPDEDEEDHNVEDEEELKDVGTSGRVDTSAKRRKILLAKIGTDLKDRLSKDAVCDTFSHLPPLKFTLTQTDWKEVKATPQTHTLHVMCVYVVLKLNYDTLYVPPSPSQVFCVLWIWSLPT